MTPAASSPASAPLGTAVASASRELAPLFRAEVARRSQDRLSGTISLALPLGWQVIGYTLLAGLAAAALFLVTASYARVVTAAGVVKPDVGVANIAPSRAGVVTAIAVAEGQRVSRGDRLMDIRLEDGIADGVWKSERLSGTIIKQKAQLAVQREMLLAAAAADRARLEAQIAGLRREIASVDGQIGDQRRLIDVAARSFDNARRIAAAGFLSRQDLDEREATLLGRRQALAQLEQLRTAKLGDIDAAGRAIHHSTAIAEAQVAATRVDEGALYERQVAIDSARGYVIAAPVSGVVTALTARVGHTVTPGHLAMLIVPEQARYKAKLYVPSSAIAFVQVGQQVHIALDAFPFQRFGTVPARIDSVSASTIEGIGDGGAPMYLVTATPLAPGIRAFGEMRPMQSGMSLTARIVTEQHSLLEWLFEPLYSVANR